MTRPPVFGNDAADLPPGSSDQTGRRPSSSQSIRRLGEGATLRIAPELSDPVGPLEIRKHKNVKKLRAWRGAESIEELT
jgi:hypothetical protein